MPNPFKIVWRALKSAQATRTTREKPVLHFLHIGKTGGTAMGHTLNNCATDCRYAIRLHGHEVRLRDVPTGIFFVVRDPVSRFVSGFYSRQRQGQPRHLSPWSPEEKEAFECFKTPNELAISIFSLDGEKKGRAQKAMRSIQHVRDSYWKWFENEQYFRSRLSDIFFIGFQESLDKDFDVLRLKLGLPDGVRLPNDDLQAHKNPPHLDKRLEEKAIENLKQWYADDYRFLNLCRELVALPHLEVYLPPDRGR